MSRWVITNMHGYRHGGWIEELSSATERKQPAFTPKGLLFPLTGISRLGPFLL